MATPRSRNGLQGPVVKALLWAVPFALLALSPTTAAAAPNPPGFQLPVEIDVTVFAPVLVPTGKLTSRGIRPGEADAYHRVLDHARRVEPARLEAAARRFLDSRRQASRNPAIRRAAVEEFPVFVDLFNNVNNPAVYLGKPVTLRGHLRKLVTMPAGENEYGIETLYEAWLYTSDGQEHPAVVVTTSVPDSLLREISRLKAENRPVLVNGITVSGYFFKMYGYPAKDAPRFAPLVLGGRLRWAPPAPSGLGSAMPVGLAVGLVIVGLPLGWFLWRNRRDDRRWRREQQAEHPERLELSAETVEALEATPGVAETMGRGAGDQDVERPEA